MHHGDGINRTLSVLSETSEHVGSATTDEHRTMSVIDEKHEHDASSAVPNDEATSLTAEQIQEFFVAVEQGSIDRLQQLFDSFSPANPNITQYAEPLLMAAIRARQEPVAKYLVEHLPIDIHQTVELLEFLPRSKAPIRNRIVSCRDLAYEAGMMDLVDLIDIASDEVKPYIKRYLQRRLNLRAHQLASEQPEKSHGNPVLPETAAPKEVTPRDDARPHKSHIDTVIETISGSNDKSIDEVGEKRFRFSGYTLRFRSIDSSDENRKLDRSPRPQTTLPLLERLPSTAVRFESLSRPLTTAPRVRHLRHPLPIRETRTSICRSIQPIRPVHPPKHSTKL